MIGLLAGISLLVGVLVGAGAGGGSGARPIVHPAPGYFARLKQLAGGGPGSFASIQHGAENAAINRTLKYTPYVRIAGSQHREIALTFDDGPGPYTPQVLSILEHSNVPATFFEVGVEEHYFHASTAAIAARGYPIGDHTENHAPMGHLSSRDQKAQLLEQIRDTGKYGAAYPRLFRPPYGSWDNATLKILKKLHMLMVLWTVDTSDYRHPGVSTIVHAAVSGARPGAIVLLHDAGGDRTETVQALPRIIRALRARGYKLVTVPRLLLDNPAADNQQISAVIGAGG
jgi:peptidoglycan/xylan/chitin deacetylase (PgdA/CDA1 family)